MKSYFKSLAREIVSIEMPVDYKLVNSAGKELILLLHGFAQNAEIILHQFKGAFPDDVAVLAVNGLFPLPERKSQGFEVRFAWYLYDSIQDEYFINHEPAVAMLRKLLEVLKLDHLPKRIVGYSQGGYLAPFVAQNLSHVKQVVGVSSSYLVDEISLPVTYRLDSLHGEADDVVECLPAQKNHREMISQGMTGTFEALSGETHRLTPAFAPALKRLLSLS